MNYSLPLAIFYILLLFSLCFAIVHTARLVRFGWEYQKKPPKTPEKREEEKQQQQQQTDQSINRAESSTH